VTNYRADIDGLRAIAVIPVLLYHVGVPGFSGGFVGVDIFFVISGYLICGMIDGDIRNGSFSLANFYKRRILRILPALFAVFLVTSVLAAFYCLPVELVDYARSLASAVASVSNVYFAQTAGYFDAPAETKPLLHTWSLGVEEQFYFAAPLLMLLVHRVLPKRAGLLFALIAVVSFAGALEMNARNPTFAFYLAPFRAWAGAGAPTRRIPSVPESVFWRNACGASDCCCCPASSCSDRHLHRALAVTGLAGHDAGDCVQRARRLSGGTVAVAPAIRVRRADILFALSVALAADRVPANRRHLLHGVIGIEQADVDRAFFRHRLFVVEAGRDAVPCAGEGSIEDRYFRCDLDHDGRDGRAVRDGDPVERSPVPLSQAHRRNRFLPGL
jgi:hypothetical protein